jgi:selenocysteine lyase/cysteine desulfurase
VRCADGSLRPSRHLDYAATAPALRAAADAALEVLPHYGSIHRGAGVESATSTAAYEHARSAVSSFLGAAPDQLVVFVRNTTEALNLLAHCLPASARVLSTPGEHHANMLPWRRREADLLPFTQSADELLTHSAVALASGRYDLFAVSGASNVTGEILPIRELTELAHQHGAEICVDAAQLAPHVPIDLEALGIDHLALSGHKLYAPFGVGVLVARGRCIAAAEPLLHGGGAVARVLDDRVGWSDAQEIARRLAEEHAISVRPGAFCAHPLVRHLRTVSRGVGGGAVRASLGIGSGIEDIEVLANALGALIGARTRRVRRARSAAHLAASVAGLLGSR